MVTVLSTFGQVALVNESWNDVAVLQIEVVVGTVDVCGDHTGEHAAIPVSYTHLTLPTIYSV